MSTSFSAVAFFGVRFGVLLLFFFFSRVEILGEGEDETFGVYFLRSSPLFTGPKGERMEDPMSPDSRGGGGRSPRPLMVSVVVLVLLFLNNVVLGFR